MREVATWFKLSKAGPVAITNGFVPVQYYRLSPSWVQSQPVFVLYFCSGVLGKQFKTTGYAQSSGTGKALGL